MTRDVVERLSLGSGGLMRNAKEISCAAPLPSRDDIHGMLNRLRGILFPGYFGESEIRPDSVAYHVGSELDRVRRTMEEQVKRSLCFACEECEQELSCEPRAG